MGVNAEVALGMLSLLEGVNKELCMAILKETDNILKTLAVLLR